MKIPRGNNPRIHGQNIQEIIWVFGFSKNYFLEDREHGRVYIYTVTGKMFNIDIQTTLFQYRLTDTVNT